jgi:hypothetical protein
LYSNLLADDPSTSKVSFADALSYLNPNISLLWL